MPRLWLFDLLTVGLASRIAASSFPVHLSYGGDQ